MLRHFFNALTGKVRYTKIADNNDNTCQQHTSVGELFSGAQPNQKTISLSPSESSLGGETNADHRFHMHDTLEAAVATFFA